MYNRIDILQAIDFRQAPRWVASSRLCKTPLCSGALPNDRVILSRTLTNLPPTRIRRLLLAILGLAALHCTLAQPLWAQLVTSDHQPAAGPTSAVKLTLAWPQPVTVVSQMPPGELVLRFDQPINYDAFAAVVPRLSAWVSAAFFGFDSLVLKLTVGCTAEVTLVDGKVVVHLSLPHTGHTEVAATAPTAGRVRLRRLKADVMWATGQTWQAAEILDQLSQENPDSPELLAARSVVATQLERWRQASEHLDQAARLQNHASRGHWPIRGSEHAPRSMVEMVRDSQTGVGDRLGLRASGHTFLAAGLRAGAAYEWAHMATLSADRHIGSVHLRLDGRSGSWCAARGGASGADLFAGGQCGLWSTLGTTTLSANFAEPRMDLPAFASLGLTRHELGVSQSVRSLSSVGRALAGEVSAQFNAGWQQWTASSAQSHGIAAGAAVQYTSRRARPRITAAWLVQHWQPLSGSAADPVQSSTGGGFASLLSRFHVHTAALGVQVPLWQWLMADVHGGYGINAFGSNSVVFGGGIGWTPASGPRASLRYQSGMVPTGAGATLASATAALGWAF